MNEPIWTTYAAARSEIRTADLLLFRRRRWWTKPIAVAGRSEYTHAAMAGWWADRLMCVEMTAGGGRATLLSNLVERWPGAIDVYRANPSRRRFSRGAALGAMVAVTGRRYGWIQLARVVLLHLPVARFFASSWEEAEDASRPPFCSQAVAAAYRAGGTDPVPNLPDRLTEPADLARSRFFQYRFTLTP